MKLFECDFCKEQTVGDAPVTLSGVPGRGGILLPDRYHSKDFCCVEHFWKWVAKNKPVETVKPFIPQGHGGL